MNSLKLPSMLFLLFYLTIRWHLFAPAKIAPQHTKSLKWRSPLLVIRIDLRQTLEELLCGPIITLGTMFDTNHTTNLRIDNGINQAIPSSNLQPHLSTGMRAPRSFTSLSPWSSTLVSEMKNLGSLRRGGFWLAAGGTFLPMLFFRRRRSVQTREFWAGDSRIVRLLFMLSERPCQPHRLFQQHRARDVLSCALLSSFPAYELA